MTDQTMRHIGGPEKPVVILIHGLGMNSYFWANPARCFVLGGLAPLTIFLAEHPDNTKTGVNMGSVDPAIKAFWSRLVEENFSVISWSQSQPLGPVEIAVNELRTTVDRAVRKWPARTIYLVGHSRGGLIARRYLLDGYPENIKGLVTICSPHAGSNMARYAGYLSPIGIFLKKILPAASQSAVAKALKRLSIFLQSPAIEELRPAADFIQSIDQPLPEKLRLLSFGGTSPALFQIYYKRSPDSDYSVLKFPDLLMRAIAAELLPPELIPGSGDALVSADSSNLPGSIHHNLPVNHVKAVFDPTLQDTILGFLAS